MRYSGKFVVRLPPETHRALKAEANRRGVSLNELCLERLQLTPSRESGASSPLSLLFQKMGISPLGWILFGSQARKEATATSDTDLLIVLPPGSPVQRELYSQWDAAVKEFPVLAFWTPHFVNLPRAAQEAGGLWFEVAVDGVVLSDPSGKIARILSQIRGLMAQGQLLRRRSHGHAYWIRKVENEE